MVTDLYLEKFERVVDLLRVTGGYTAVLIAGTEYELTSDVETYLAENDYIVLDATIPVRVVSVSTAKVFRVESEIILPDFGIWKAKAPYSDYGTRKTLNIRMIEKNGYQFKYQKYPLIALRLPTVISTRGATHTIDANILIATFTSKVRKEKERIETTFKPILYPLMTRFLEMCKLSGEFTNFNHDHDQIDRMFYGSEAGDDTHIANVFSDPLDAVELRNLKLNFLVENCNSSNLATVDEGHGFPYIFEKVFEG